MVFLIPLKLLIQTCETLTRGTDDTSKRHGVDETHKCYEQQILVTYLGFDFFGWLKDWLLDLGIFFLIVH